jgi:N-methylhydantoinase A
MPGYSVAVDIGGTFTDVIVIDRATGESRIAKVLSTPPDLSQGIVEGIHKILPTFGEIDFFAHGTTAGLNALLERRGVKASLVTTEGFRDVYEMGRSERVEMYDPAYHRQPRLIPRSAVFEVSQRTLADGTVSKPVDLGSTTELVAAIKAGGFESVAICFLHSYTNPSEEERLAAHLREQLPNIPVSVSHEIANEWREYERTSTVVMNAYIAPIVERYLEQLDMRMSDDGLGEPIHIMQSNGGVMTAATARRHPLRTLLSGPVGGAIGGQAVGHQIGNGNVLTIDMGGTSFDVSMVVDGQLEVANETEIEGFPLLTPMVNIHTIGAGGGSVAFAEAGGLRVGPRSAGSVPGPAAYGRGGKEPTVTDANLLLGRLGASDFLGGGMTLDVAAAEQAHQALADELGLDPIDLAEGIIDIVNAKMANAIRTLTVARGIDPRGFALTAFGGAGPLHAAFLAEELEIPSFVVPANPGIFSAWGMLRTDIRHDLVQSFYRPAETLLPEELQSAVDGLRERAIASLVEEHIAEADMSFTVLADMRYVGQEYVVTATLAEPGEPLPAAGAIVERFHDVYEARFGYSVRGASVEFVNLRLAAVGKLARMEAAPVSTEQGSTATPITTRKVRFKREWHTAGIYDRAQLLPGQVFAGPAIVNELSATTVIPPAHSAQVDGYGNLIVRSTQA